MRQQGLTAIGILILSVLLYAGGKPNPGTKRDQRLKENKPKSSKPTLLKKGKK